MRIIKNLKSYGFFVGQELTVIDKEFIQEQGPSFLSELPYFCKDMYECCGKRAVVTRTIKIDEEKEVCKIDIDIHDYSWAPFYFKEFYK